MTEFQIGAGLQETNNKGKKQQATKTNSASVKDIALFGDNKKGQGPLRPEEYKIPSIFDGSYDYKSKNSKLFPTPKKTDPIKVPYMSKEMREEYNRDTIVTIYKSLNSTSMSKANTQRLYENIHRLDYQNYKLAFCTFEQAGVPLVDVINQTKHLSNAQKKNA